MTVKEASRRFSLDEKVIRQCQKDGMIIGLRKEGKTVVIPDDTIIIPMKRDIQSFIFQIIQYKNNPSFPISRRICPDQKSLCAVMKYLFLRGFIGEVDCDKGKSIEDIFSTVKLTEGAFSFIFGAKQYCRIIADISAPIQINPSINFNVIHIGL